MHCYNSFVGGAYIRLIATHKSRRQSIGLAPMKTLYNLAAKKEIKQEISTDIISVLVKAPELCTTSLRLIKLLPLIN